MKPLCIDTFCGWGGWAEGFLDAGYRVVGFDVDRSCAPHYAGEFVQADVQTLNGAMFKDAHVIVESPPCTEFSEFRYIRKETKPPDMALVNAAFRIRREAKVFGVPTLIENVRGARRFFPEPSVGHRGAFYFWGDFPLLDNKFRVPLKMGAQARVWTKNGLSERRTKANGYNKSKDPRESAKIPRILSRAIAEAFLSWS